MVARIPAQAVVSRLAPLAGLSGQADASVAAAGTSLYSPQHSGTSLYSPQHIVNAFAGLSGPARLAGWGALAAELDAADHLLHPHPQAVPSGGGAPWNGR
eukprot:252921-Prorocentrum_minimum.AAC.1